MCVCDSVMKSSKIKHIDIKGIKTFTSTIMYCITYEIYVLLLRANKRRDLAACYFLATFIII